MSVICPPDRNVKVSLLLFIAAEISEWSFPRPFTFGKEGGDFSELTWTCPSDTLLVKKHQDKKLRWGSAY